MTIFYIERELTKAAIEGTIDTWSVVMSGHSNGFSYWVHYGKSDCWHSGYGTRMESARKALRHLQTLADPATTDETSPAEDVSIAGDGRAA